MKYTVFIGILIASAAAMPSVFRRDAVGDAVAQFDKLTDGQKADFLEQITAENAGSVQGVNSAGGAAGSGNGKDVVADVNAAAVDDGEANVAIKGSNDIQVKADVQALDDGVVNLNIQGQFVTHFQSSFFLSLSDHQSPIGNAQVIFQCTSSIEVLLVMDYYSQSPS